MEKKIQITMRALLQRINRVLIKDGKVLKKKRSGSHPGERGRYFLVDLELEEVDSVVIDLGSFGRQMDVIEGWEEVDGK
jgi:hypothetical protein